MRSVSLIGLAAGLLAVSVIFWAIERISPASQPVPRRRLDTRLDLLYWFFTPVVAKGGTRLVIGVIFALIARAEGVTFAAMQQVATTRHTWVSGLPVWVQIPLTLFIGDVLAYATHRLFHGRRLWPVHAIHHSSQHVDWLASVRLHPLNELLTRVAQVVPLYWMGFSGGVLAAFVPALTFYALLLHANVNWTYGPLRFVVASPAFHRWHHTTEREGLNKNFAGMFPFIDLAMGTFYMPAGRLPERFGIADERVPDGFFQQLAYPFRNRSGPAPVDDGGLS